MNSSQERFRCDYVELEFERPDAEEKKEEGEGSE